MAAPDKIYIDIIDMDCGYMMAPSFENNGGAEYIRKDALLEWMDKNIKGLNVLFGEIFIAKVKDKLKQL